MDGFTEKISLHGRIEIPPPPQILLKFIEINRDNLDNKEGKPESIIVDKY